MPGRVKHGSRPPWVGLAAAVWVQVAAGSAFTFPLYSHSLKSVLGFNQRQLTFLGVANDIGENVGILPGVVCNRLPPWTVLLVGAASSFLGFGVLWLAVSKTVLGVPFWLLWIALCIGTNSSAWLGTGVIVTNMRNFPLSRGTVAGILKGYVGLSAAVYTEIYSGFFHDSSSYLLLLLTLGIPIVSLLVMYFVRPCTPSLEDDTKEHSHFRFVQIGSVVLGIYLLTTTILNDVLDISDAISYIFVGVMVLLLLSPLAIPIQMTIFPAMRRRSGSGTVSASTSTENLASCSGTPEQSEPLIAESPSLTYLNQDDDDVDVQMLLAEGEGAVKKKRRPRRGEDFEFKEAMIKADFWLLFLAYFFGVGSGITVLNNLAQIGIAAGINDTTILLCLFAFCNFAGRLSGGAISEYFVRSNMLPRTIWMTFTQVIMVILYLLFAFGSSSVVYGSTALLGICYGFQFSVMVPTSSELFGLEHFGVIYNFMLLGNPLGALLFSGLLAGFLYDQEEAKQHARVQSSSNESCLGPECFKITFVVLAGACTLGSILSAILTMRLRPVYQMLYASGSFRLPRNSRH